MAAFQNGGLTEQVNITATAAGTTTLVGSTSSSATLGKQIQIFTGSSTQTIVLPNATTMNVGQKFEIYNESSSVLTIQFQDASVFTDASGVNYNILAPHTSLTIKLQTNGTANGTWAVLSTASTGSGTGLNYITYGNAEAGIQGWHTVNWQQTVTITNASPAVFTVTSTTGMYVGMPISFTTTGALPTGLTASTIYFISSIPSGSTFQVSATLGGAAVNTSSAGSGTHTSYPLVPINDTTVALSNLAFSTSASSPLVGANSYTLVQTNSKAVGGEGVAYDFTIDAGYQTQVLGINVNYNASSTFVASSGAVGSDSDVEFAIWDKTNSVLIPVSPKYVTGNGANNFVYTGTFQPSANSTSYALMAYTPTMNANATGWTFKFDNVQVSPSIVSAGALIVTDWTLNTNYSFDNIGTFTSMAVYERRVGDTLEVRGKAIFGTTAAGAFAIDLPSIYTIDTTKLPSTASQEVGIIYNQRSGLAYPSVGNGAYPLFFDGSTTNKIFYCNNSNTAAFAKTNANTEFNSADGFTFELKVPIVGWTSGNTGTGGNSGANGAITASGAITGSNYTPSANAVIIYNTVLFDTNAAYSTSTGLYTCPIGGYYSVDVCAQTSAAVAGVYVVVNGTAKNYLTSSGTATQSGGSTVVKCNAGDTIGIYSDASHPFFSSTPAYLNSFSISLVSGGSVAQNTQKTVTAQYYVSSNTSTTTAQAINFDTKVFDTTASVTTGGSGAWKFTAPVSGYYSVAAQVYLSTGSSQSPTLYKNGISYGPLYTISTTLQPASYTIVQLNAGDTLSVNMQSTGTIAGSAAFSGSPSSITIAKIN